MTASILLILALASPCKSVSFNASGIGEEKKLKNLEVDFEIIRNLGRVIEGKEKEIAGYLDEQQIEEMQDQRNREPFFKTSRWTMLDRQIQQSKKALAANEKARQELADKTIDAVRDLYRIAPERRVGRLNIGGQNKGDAVEWKPRFGTLNPRQWKDIHGIAHMIAPNKTKTAATTWFDGRIEIGPHAFEKSPGMLAAYIVHETVHFDRNTLEGPQASIRLKNSEREQEAYEKVLDPKTIKTLGIQEFAKGYRATMDATLAAIRARERITNNPYEGQNSMIPEEIERIKAKSDKDFLMSPERLADTTKSLQDFAARQFEERRVREEEARQREVRRREEVDRKWEEGNNRAFAEFARKWQLEEERKRKEAVTEQWHEDWRNLIYHIAKMACNDPQGFQDSLKKGTLPAKAFHPPAFLTRIAGWKESGSLNYCQEHTLLAVYHATDPLSWIRTGYFLEVAAGYPTPPSSSGSPGSSGDRDFPEDRGNINIPTLPQICARVGC